MTKKHFGFIFVILTLTFCLTISVIGAEYAKIISMEGSSEAEVANPPENIIDGDEVTHRETIYRAERAFRGDKRRSHRTLSGMYRKICLSAT